MFCVFELWLGSLCLLYSVKNFMVGVQFVWTFKISL